MPKRTFKQRKQKLIVEFNIWMHKVLTSVGGRLMRLGALHQPGDAIHLKKGVTPHLKSRGVFITRSKPVTRYVKDITYSFKNNKIDYIYSDKPIKDLKG